MPPETERSSPVTNDDESLKVALHPDGKIVAVGAGGDGSQGYGIVARYGAGGSLDKARRNTTRSARCTARRVTALRRSRTWS